MRTTNLAAVLIAATFLYCQGCKSQPKDTFTSQIWEPTIYDMIGVKSNAPLQIRIGYLSVDVMQHPMLSKDQDYLDLYDNNGNLRNQIVIFFEPPLSKPQDVNRPIEIKGPVGFISMGGPVGTKGEYANDVVIVKSWRYLDPRDVPMKKEVEHEPEADRQPAP